MPPVAFLFLLLLTIPIVEIFVLIEVGQSIGTMATVVLVISTAILGTLLLRWQGLHTLARVQATLNRGELPAVELVEGLILLTAGVLLLTPGFLTDALGFGCLVPIVRVRLARSLVNRFVTDHLRPHGSDHRSIKGEYRVETDRDTKN